jgi:hypothetical protein
MKSNTLNYCRHFQHLSQAKKNQNHYHHNQKHQHSCSQNTITDALQRAIPEAFRGAHYKKQILRNNGKDKDFFDLGHLSGFFSLPSRSGRYLGTPERQSCFYS